MEVEGLVYEQLLMNHFLGEVFHQQLQFLVDGHSLNFGNGWKLFMKEQIKSDIYTPPD